MTWPTAFSIVIWLVVPLLDIEYMPYPCADLTTDRDGFHRLNSSHVDEQAGILLTNARKWRRWHWVFMLNNLNVAIIKQTRLYPNFYEWPRGKRLSLYRRWPTRSHAWANQFSNRRGPRHGSSCCRRGWSIHLPQLQPCHGTMTNSAKISLAPPQKKSRSRTMIKGLSWLSLFNLSI